MKFHNEARDDSAPSRGIVPQGKGREGIRKGTEKPLTSFSTHPQSPPGSNAVPAKACTQCGEVKPLEDFYRARRNRDGRHSQCIACRKRYVAATTELRRETMRKWREANPTAIKRHAEKAKPIIRDRALAQYGLTVEDFSRLLESQGGACAICGGEQIIAGRRLAVDHDHETGDVRGLLCHRCNTGIGLLGDTAETVRKAVAYLDSPPANRGDASAAPRPEVSR